MKKETVHFKSNGESGNIFYILWLARQVLRKQRCINDYNEMRYNVFKGSYTEALAKIRKYVDLIDDEDNF